MKQVFCLILVVFVIAGCSRTRTVTVEGTGGSSVETPSETVQIEIADVTIDGTSILGAWHALEVQGDAVATQDLADGTMKMTLLVQPNGRATLAGIDNREGDGEGVRFDGAISGNQLELEGLPGAATLFMSGRRLVIRDPRGRSTIYVRGVDG